jgi:hypothetical protein
VNSKNLLVLSIFLGIVGAWIYSNKNRHLLDYIYKEQDIRVIINGKVVRIPEGSRVKDAFGLINEGYSELEALDLDLERELSDGDIIELNKGL